MRKKILSLNGGKRSVERGAEEEGQCPMKSGNVIR